MPAIAASWQARPSRRTETFTVISSLVSKGEVLVAGGIFDLNTGRVEPVALDA
jgi:hypothetical protein